MSAEKHCSSHFYPTSWIFQKQLPSCCLTDGAGGSTSLLTDIWVSSVSPNYCFLFNKVLNVFSCFGKITFHLQRFVLVCPRGPVLLWVMPPEFSPETSEDMRLQVIQMKMIDGALVSPWWSAFQSLCENSEAQTYGSNSVWIKVYLFLSLTFRS